MIKICLFWIDDHTIMLNFIKQQYYKLKIQSKENYEVG